DMNAEQLGNLTRVQERHIVNRGGASGGGAQAAPPSGSRAASILASSERTCPIAAWSYSRSRPARAAGRIAGRVASTCSTRWIGWSSLRAIAPGVMSWGSGSLLVAPMLVLRRGKEPLWKATGGCATTAGSDARNAMRQGSRQRDRPQPV